MSQSTTPLCREYDPELWFDTSEGVRDLAKRICAMCPIRVQCLQKALEYEKGFDSYAYGVWGGLAAHERVKLIRQGKTKTNDRPTTEGETAA